MAITARHERQQQCGNIDYGQPAPQARNGEEQKQGTSRHLAELVNNTGGFSMAVERVLVVVPEHQPLQHHQCNQQQPDMALRRQPRHPVTTPSQQWRYSGRFCELAQPRQDDSYCNSGGRLARSTSAAGISPAKRLSSFLALACTLGSVITALCNQR